VFHFAAQGIVSKAAENPRETITTNVLGTYNLLDACNRNENIKLFVVATTDKVYEDHSNNNIESSKLGGREFYSASKASSEHIIQAFVNTEKRGDLFIGTVRAGNVLGGGDYGKDRILTDVLNSLSKKTNITLRNPNAIRPWQYILDSIYGYLLVGEHCQIDSQNSIFNLNSELNNKYTVLNFVETLLEQWTSDYKCSIKYEEGDKFYESKILTINSSKAQNILDWCPSFDMESLCKYIAEYETSTNKYEYAISHVNSFLEKVN
jgi:CDP-glucose 4,6-dehydratase